MHNKKNFTQEDTIETNLYVNTNWNILELDRASLLEWNFFTNVPYWIWTFGLACFYEAFLCRSSFCYYLCPCKHGVYMSLSVIISPSQGCTVFSIPIWQMSTVFFPNWNWKHCIRNKKTIVDHGGILSKRVFETVENSWECWQQMLLSFYFLYQQLPNYLS